MCSSLAAWCSTRANCRDETGRQPWWPLCRATPTPSPAGGSCGDGERLLARRDAEWMGQVHRFLGLSVGLIQQEMRPNQEL